MGTKASFQLPLSGSQDRGLREGRLLEDRAGFQLPLSGSQPELKAQELAHNSNSPFNSLSRDHATTSWRGSRLWRSFKLPLSGSRLPEADFRPGNPEIFQLPLSGSHASGRLRQRSRLGQLSTPSLGITLVGAERFMRTTNITFNSLSRDHRARFRDFQALRGFLPRHLFAQMIPKTAIWIYRSAPL